MTGLIVAEPAPGSGFGGSLSGSIGDDGARPEQPRKGGLAIDRKPEGRLEDLVLFEAGAEAQVESRNTPRQVARQLRPASSKEEVDDREVVWTAARGLERLGPGTRDVYVVTLSTKDDSQGAAAPLVGFDEQNGTGGLHDTPSSNPRTRPKERT
jgi:hypothetical protein